jgi:diguanylate cyclase (GGDEF)-like protein/PAS domain S-box-containing protein
VTVPVDAVSATPTAAVAVARAAADAGACAAAGPAAWGVDGTVAGWATLVDNLPQAAWLVELAAMRVVAANAAAAALLGRPADELLGSRADELLATPEDLAWWAEAAQGVVGALGSETVLCSADGRAVRVERFIRPLAAAPGQAASHCLVMLNDRSEQQRAADERDALVGELQATLEATADGILVTDNSGRIRAFNQRFAQMWGLPAELLRTRDDAAVADWLRRNVQDIDGYDARLASVKQGALMLTTDRLTLLSGEVFERVTRPLWSGGRSQGRVFSYRDLTERLAAEQRIEALSTTDALTGLPNRDQLATLMASASVRVRREGHCFALLVVNLDRFRKINDSLGHDTGDRVLLDAARRVQGCLRTGDALARTGGDQFAVLLEGADAQAAESTARRVLNVVAQPFEIDDAPFTMTCSIGVALSPAHGQVIDELMRHAEAAMRAVKVGGRGNYRLHQPHADVDLRMHMRLDHALRLALVSGRFRLHSQPLVDLRDGRLVGAEALIRWRDPELGEMSPATFIPVAEDTGFIVAIGDWVLSQAVRQATLWHERGLAVPIAVNVSALQFQQAQFVDRVMQVLAVSGLPPALLELELTESILVHDAQEALQRLHALAQLGVRLSIDDFGTGYSSLAYLKRFPIGTLKIDRSFIKGLPGDDSDAGIVRAIIQMARALGKTVIAEGVETEAQRQFLLDIGCDQFQGWLYAPALDSVSFEKRLVGRAEVAGSAGAARIRLVSG